MLATNRIGPRDSATTTFLLLYWRSTTDVEWEREGPVMAFSDDLLHSGAEQAALVGAVLVEREPTLRRYEVVG
jgi:hypothetical protein